MSSQLPFLSAVDFLALLNNFTTKKNLDNQPALLGSAKFWRSTNWQRRFKSRWGCYKKINIVLEIKCWYFTPPEMVPLSSSWYAGVVKDGGLLQFLTPKPKIFQVKKVKVQNHLKLNFVDWVHWMSFLTHRFDSFDTYLFISQTVTTGCTKSQIFHFREFVDSESANKALDLLRKD